jgi:hypothetical protein
MEQGLGGLDVPDDLVGDEYTAAGGGIVAFQNQGEVPEPEEATLPFGDAARGMFNYIGGFKSRVENDPKNQITQLQSDRVRLKQGLFDALTPSQKQARAEQIRAVEQKIAALQSGLTAPAVPAPMISQSTSRSSMPLCSLVGARDISHSVHPKRSRL